MTVWTDPTHVVPNSKSNSTKFNTETVDNIAWLHNAWSGQFRRDGGWGLTQSVTGACQWDVADWETINMWSASPYPERLCPGLAGIWLVTAQWMWPADSTETATVQFKCQKNGATDIAIDNRDIRVGEHTYTRIVTQVSLNGIGDYINFNIWTNRGGGVLGAAHGQNYVQMTWMGSL